MNFPSPHDTMLGITIAQILACPEEHRTYWLDGFDYTGQDLGDYLFDLLEGNAR